MVVNLPGDAFLPVDSKAPMDDYLKATEMDTPELQDAAFADHAKKVRSHAEALGKKDYAGQNVGGPSFTVMFLPIESLLAEAMRFEPDLLQFAADRKVVLATPHTLMALLWTVRTLWRNETSTRNAEEMRNAGLELEKRLNIFLDHLADVGSGLSSATRMYNKAVGSLEGRLHPQLRKLRELGGLPEEAPGKKVPAPANEFPRPPPRPGNRPPHRTQPLRLTTPGWNANPQAGIALGAPPSKPASPRSAGLQAGIAR